jgi:nitrate reductase NapD
MINMSGEAACEAKPPLNIAGVLVHADPQHAPQVRGAIERLPGVEVHAISAAGQLVVTVEGENDEGMLSTLEALRTAPAVHAVALVYHHSEPDESPSCANKEPTP